MVEHAAFGTVHTMARCAGRYIELRSRAFSAPSWRVASDMLGIWCGSEHLETQLCAEDDVPGLGLGGGVGTRDCLVGVMFATAPAYPGHSSSHLVRKPGSKARRARQKMLNASR